MKCPKCGSNNHRVLDSRPVYTIKKGVHLNYIRRRRECECGLKWTTKEICEESLDINNRLDFALNRIINSHIKLNKGYLINDLKEVFNYYRIP